MHDTRDDVEFPSDLDCTNLEIIMFSTAIAGPLYFYDIMKFHQCKHFGHFSVSSQLHLKIPSILVNSFISWSKCTLPCLDT